MEFNKWLKRKYPKHYNELVSNFKVYELEYLKLRGHKIGRLLEINGENLKGDLVIYHRTKEYIEANENGYEYPSEGGWTGSFEYYYTFSKSSGMMHNSSYVLIADPIDKDKL